jgi:hypothetical protein
MRTKIEASLIELGYQLKDFGNHWRANAAYRNGNNPSSLMIYKDTGVWRDFVENKAPMPFKKLVELTLNTKDYSIINKYVDFSESSNTDNSYVKKEKLEMEKIYPDDCLKKLFPNFSFYEKRAINEEVQKMYKCGLASAGKMYRRVVFPVFNLNKQIHGFSGRKVDDNSDAPKWKHIGLKSTWIYPAMIPDFPEIEDKVILVESIGDSMALTQNGFTNNLVMFGLDCGPNLMNFLVSRNLKEICISSNNDSDSTVNRGLVASVKILIKLSCFFDLDVLKIKPPLMNDFGEMQMSDNSLIFCEWNKRNPLSIQDIVKIIEENKSEFNKTKVNKFLKKCQNE